MVVKDNDDLVAVDEGAIDLDDFVADGAIDGIIVDDCGVAGVVVDDEFLRPCVAAKIFLDAVDAAVDVEDLFTVAVVDDLFTVVNDRFIVVAAAAVVDDDVLVDASRNLWDILSSSKTSVWSAELALSSESVMGSLKRMKGSK